MSTTNDSSEDEYQFVFSVDGNMSVIASSVENAEKLAIDALEALDSMDANSFEIEGCSIRVTARVTEDAHERIEGKSVAVEFAS